MKITKWCNLLLLYIETNKFVVILQYFAEFVYMWIATQFKHPLHLYTDIVVLFCNVSWI